MKKQSKDNQNRRVKIISEYSGFDFFLIKKPVQCTIRIPDTVMLDHNGAPKDWVFNSGKLPNHPILKKRRQNLLPLTITKNICSKYIPMSIIGPLKGISDLKDTVKTVLLQKKDAEFANKKKHLQIHTSDNQILQIGILQFLDYIGQNKLAEQSFYEKWRMIQERVSLSKIDQCYNIESVRKNHIIQSKSSKFISINYGSKNKIDQGAQTAFRQSPSQQLQVNDTKTIQGYKFFDSYLNKKFFTSVQQLIECIQKNYKCIVQNISTRFVIDHNREPHLIAMQQIYVKPAIKLFTMRQFSESISEGSIKLQSYVKCLNQYIFQNPAKPQPNLNEPLYTQRKLRCRGQFCEAYVLNIPHQSQPRIKLPFIGGSSTRKMSLTLIQAVKKRKGRVIQKLKENGVIDHQLCLDNQQSSQFQESDLQNANKNVKVCQNCFIFYLNVMKFFQVDIFGNLIEKRAASLPKMKTSGDESSNQKRLDKSLADFQNPTLIDKRKQRYKSMKNLDENQKIAEQHIEQKQRSQPTPRRTTSHHSKLRPINQASAANHSLPKSLRTQQNISKSQPKLTKIQKKDVSVGKKKQIVVESKVNKLIEAKLVVAKAQQMDKNKIMNRSSSKKMNVRPTNFKQACEQLLYKLDGLPNSSQEQLITSCKKYYKDNLPQFVDRLVFSSQYLVHIYEFMSHSPIAIATGNRIKKRPQMSLKRLSQLTNYPEIVSRSTFIFDTLICDQKTTIPFCVISSKMIHNHNNANIPYTNVVFVNDIFDSYIQYISMAKQLLQDVENTRILLYNYPGQSHTIYDKNGALRTTEHNAIIDKLIFRLSSYSGQLNIFSSVDSYKFVGFGYGGYLISSYLSANPAMHKITNGTFLINCSANCTPKYKAIIESLIQFYSINDQPTEDNAFLYYNKAINSHQIGKEDLQSKAGLNSIRLDGRVFLLKNMLQHWNEATTQNFSQFTNRVDLLYGRANILISKSDMQRYLFKQDHQKTTLPNRNVIQIDGGHDLSAENYFEQIKYLQYFIK